MALLLLQELQPSIQNRAVRYDTSHYAAGIPWNVMSLSMDSLPVTKDMKQKWTSWCPAEDSLVESSNEVY